MKFVRDRNFQVFRVGPVGLSKNFLTWLRVKSLSPAIVPISDLRKKRKKTDMESRLAEWFGSEKISRGARVRFSLLVTFCFARVLTYFFARVLTFAALGPTQCNSSSWVCITLSLLQPFGPPTEVGSSTHCPLNHPSSKRTLTRRLVSEFSLRGRLPTRAHFFVAVNRARSEHPFSLQTKKKFRAPSTGREPTALGSATTTQTH